MSRFISSSKWRFGTESKKRRFRITDIFIFLEHGSPGQCTLLYAYYSNFRQIIKLQT